MTNGPGSQPVRRPVVAFAGGLAAVVLAVPSAARAQQPGITGSWQIAIDCGLFPYEYATATEFRTIEEADGGARLVSRSDRCATLAVPGSIRQIDCVLPAPGSDIGYDGTAVWIPEDGPVVTVAEFDEPFPFPLLGCSEVATIISQLEYLGVVERDDGGSVVAIRGDLLSGPIEMRDSVGRACFELPSVFPCRFEMRRNDVSPGSNVTVEPRAGTRLTFAEVLTPGTAAVVPLTELNAALPPGFRVVGSSVQVVFEVTTNSEFVAPVRLCVAYPDDDGDGFVDGTNPPASETNVRILHEEDGAFVDRTVSLDTEANEVCGETNGLSQFALADASGDVEPPIDPPPTVERLAPWRDPPAAPSRERRGIGRRVPMR